MGRLHLRTVFNPSLNMFELQFSGELECQLPVYFWGTEATDTVNLAKESHMMNLRAHVPNYLGIEGSNSKSSSLGEK